MMNKILLSLKNVGIVYKIRSQLFQKPEFHTAFENVSFDLYEGETLGITGGNGAGKSTLLRVLAGIHQPDMGHIENYGASTALLTLQAGFDNDLTGRDNIIVGSILLGLSHKDALSEIPQIIEFSGLGEFIDRPIRTYSEGMKARLGFSIAMQVSPDILLLDEVLSVGDKEFQRKSRELTEKKVNSSRTVVIVSHSDKTLNRLCDRKMELTRQGVLVQ